MPRPTGLCPRRDVYAIRWENARYGKSGWMPAVEGRLAALAPTVADFDGQAAMLDALAYLKAARASRLRPRWSSPALE